MKNNKGDEDMSKQGYIMSRGLHDDALRAAIDNKIALCNDAGIITTETVKKMLAASLGPTAANSVLDERIKSLPMTCEWWIVDSAEAMRA